MLINLVRECGFLDFSNTGLVYLEIDGRISIVLFVFCLRRALDFDKNFATAIYDVLLVLLHRKRHYRSWLSGF